MPHCEQFELKFGMRGEEGLSTNFTKFHGDCATSTMFSHRCRKTYRTDLVFFKNFENIPGDIQNEKCDQLSLSQSTLSEAEIVRIGKVKIFRYRFSKKRLYAHYP